ncbi:MAG: hypothetical protein H5T69_09925, partial [Chloroflexi bacterium]|nr:hypothetical protein [Chloroflexota bacterium]
MSETSNTGRAAQKSERQATPSAASEPQSEGREPTTASRQNAPPPSPPKPESHLKAILTGVTAFLTAVGALVAAISSLFNSMNQASWLRKASPSPTPAVILSATPLPTATVPIVVVTATAASPSALFPPTPAPMATTISMPTNTPTPQGLVIRETFSQLSPEWGLESRTDYQVEVVNGELQILVREFDASVWVQVPGTCELSDMIVEVDVRQVAGSDDGNMGIAVREGTDSHLYLFAISRDGWYMVNRLQGEEWQELVPWTESASILQGGQ